MKNLHLLATASTANIFDLGEKKDALRITLPFYGRTETQIQGKKTRIIANEMGMITGPYHRATGFCEPNHCLIIAPCREKLIDTAKSMLSEETFDDSFLNLEQTRELSLRGTGYAISAYFLALSRLIEDLLAFPEVLHNIGIEDLILRQLVYLLAPESFRVSSETSSLTPHDRVFDLICDKSLARLEQPLTLTEMEELSGLSAKQFTKEFRLRFGCTPMEWQRRERLTIARERLLNGDRIVNIARLSNDLGFTSAKSFSLHYTRQFGEKPDETFHRNYLLRSGFRSYLQATTRNYA
jgi:AraC-like DNA-binding protein